MPEDMRVRNAVISKVRGVFENYGFEELQTPVLETQEVLLGKYGEEAERLMYLFEDQGKRKVGMRYDLTVPFARVAATNHDLPRPFKRYQMQPVWRADNTQKGRYREFLQCDVDTIGSNSPLSDAEIVSVIDAVFKALEFTNYKIRINSRSVLFSVMGRAGVLEDKWLTAIQSIDKLDKKSKEQVEIELSEKGFKNEVIKDIFSKLKKARPDSFLEETIKYAIKSGVSGDILVFDPVLSRGLDYYTGPVYESTVTEPKMGSLTGGGRYDNLLKTLGGPDLPGVGTTMGIERIIDVLSELKMVHPNESNNRVLVSVFGIDFIQQSIDTANALRAENIKTELYAIPEDKLGKQLKYADKKDIRYVVIIGEDEVKQNKVTLKNMVSGESTQMALQELVATLSEIS